MRLLPIILLAMLLAGCAGSDDVARIRAEQDCITKGYSGAILGSIFCAERDVRICNYYAIDYNCYNTTTDILTITTQGRYLLSNE